MRKKDIIAVLVLGEIVAIFLGFIIKGLGLNFGFPIFILYIILPVLALVMNVIFYLIGKKIPIFFQFAKFITVGLANTAVDFGVLNFLMWASGTYEGKTIILFNVISFLIAAIHSYLWNKLWTFEVKGKLNIANQFLQFIIVSLVGVLINSGIIYIITTWFSSNVSKGVWVNVAKVFATVVSLVWNFIGYKFIVFKKKDEQSSGNLS